MTSTEILTAGYADLAEAITSRWLYVELQETDGTPIVRRELVTGSNAEWTDEVPPLMTIVVEVTGTDSDLPSLPLTFGKFAFYKVASGGDEMGTTDFDSSFTLASSTDSVTITGNLELPEIV